MNTTPDPPHNRTNPDRAAHPTPRPAELADGNGDQTPHPADWQPATSKPGELLTIEGQVRAVGAFAAGLRNNDPRLAPYRRSMARTGLTFVALGIGVTVVAIILDTFL